MTEICSKPKYHLSILDLSDEGNSTSTEKVIHDYILPLPRSVDEEAAWVDRLLLVMQYLDPQTSEKGLLRATRLQERRPGIYERFLDACVAYNVGKSLKSESSANTLHRAVLSTKMQKQKRIHSS